MQNPFFRIFFIQILTSQIEVFFIAFYLIKDVENTVRQSREMNCKLKSTNFPSF